MKIWVFSQVSRFSSDPLILIFESSIQSGGSSLLILEHHPSGVISSRSEKIPDRRPPFSPFRSRVRTHFCSRRISPQIWDDPTSYGNQRSVGFLPRFGFSSSFCFSVLVFSFFDWVFLVVRFVLSSSIRSSVQHLPCVSFIESGTRLVHEVPFKRVEEVDLYNELKCRSSRVFPLLCDAIGFV